MIEKVYVHYGDCSFNKEKFKPIQNRKFWTKPIGGLWGSPLDTDWGWKDWCLDENFRVDRLKDSFKFTLMNSARMLSITSPEDFDPLPKLEGSDVFKSMVCLDFEELCKNYDAIEVAFGGDLDFETLLGWDCDSILVFNPDVVREIISAE